ncbi:MAG: hypothetical protein Aureis2KO_23870 [Aureisphaera sp.]
MKKLVIIIVAIVVTSCSSSYEVVHIANAPNEPSIVYAKKINSNSDEVFELISLPKKENTQNSVLIKEGGVYRFKLKKSLRINLAAYNGKTNPNNTLRDSIDGYKVKGDYYCPDLFGLNLYGSNRRSK